VVNEQDLIRALNKGNIGGAGLDVFEREPITKTSPLLKMNNVVLLPHIGSASYETRSKMGVIAVKNLLDVLNGKEPDPKFVVNPEVIDVSRQRTN
jgi:phosphoglycerate dehydrogenase-like enzyme